MGCPSCSADNPAAARFCMSCGAALAVFCPACGQSNPPVARFCMQCGAALDAPDRPTTPADEPPTPPPQSYTPRHLAEKILAARAALEGERKQVTVLFADVVGSTELIRDRDPEEAQQLLDGALRAMMDAVHRYEGTVSRLTGDGLMALFGAPLAHEDHAVRACYAALALQDAMRRYAEQTLRQHGAEIHARVGLNSGEVVVRLVSDDLHLDYTALGQTVHLAARMEQTAGGGTILLTAETLALAEGYIRVRSIGPTRIKGLAELVEVFELLGAGTIRTRFQASAARGLTAFVGREREVEAITRTLDLARAGHGQVVALVGEPGVGKSRLFYEFTHSDPTRGWLVLKSGSVSYGKATSWLQVIDLLKAYFRIEPRDEVSAIREKVAGKVLMLDRALEPTLPALLALLDVPVEDPAWQALDPHQRRRQMLDAVRLLLLRESQVQPLLLVFEDLHWIDAETQALLDSLVDSLPTARIVLLVNYRPEYEHAWHRKPFYQPLRLEPLPAARAGELLDALLGRDDALEPLKRLLIERTEGNPFFLEESGRALVEGGALLGERGTYRLAQPVASMRVPATVQAVLAARIDRLAPEDKRLLQCAAVVGTDVPYALLRAIAELSEDALRPGLARLQAAEFLYETSLFPEPEYTFKHALTHEVAYGSLLHDRRRQLHTAIVEAMEHRYAGRLTEHAERLAHHAVRGEEWAKAVTHLWQAGRNARGRSAYHQAVAFLEQAVETLTRLPNTAENARLAIDLICRDLGDPLTILAHNQRLLEHLDEAARLAQEVGDRARLANVLARMLPPLRWTGQLDRAAQVGERALTLATEVGDSWLNALAGTELSVVHYFQGDTRRAEILLTQALVALDSLPAGTGASDRTWLRRMILENLVRVLASTGRYREAVSRGEEAVRMAEDLGHPAPIAWTLGRLGRVYLAFGDVDQAIALSARSLALAREREVHNLIEWASADLGVAFALAGNFDEAFARLEEAVAVGQSTGSLNPSTLVSLGRAYLSAGRLEDASRYAREALAVCRQRTVRTVEAEALHLIGDIAARREPRALDDAVQRYRQALALSDDLGMRPLVAHCHLGLGKLYREIGRREEARAELSTAIEMFRSMEMTSWLPQAEAALAGLIASTAAKRTG